MDSELVTKTVDQQPEIAVLTDDDWVVAQKADGGLMGKVRASSLRNGGLREELEGGAIGRVIYLDAFPYYAKGNYDPLTEEGDDDTAVIAAAMMSGATTIYATPGKKYKVTSLPVPHVNLEYFGAEGPFEIHAGAGLNSKALPLFPGQFYKLENLHLWSRGDGSDGFATIGISSDSAALLTLAGIRTSGFSGYGVRIRACVKARIRDCVFNVDGGSPGVGLGLLPLGAAPCTTVNIDDSYLLGGRNALRAEDVVGLHINLPAIELAGDAGVGAAANGAAHLERCSGTIIGDYYEGNVRDWVMRDCRMVGINTVFKAGETSASIVEYSAMPFADRGFTRIGSNSADVRYLNGDPTTGGDLLIQSTGGKTGFGTASPDSILHVVAGAGASAAGLRIGFNNTSVNYYDANSHNFRGSASNDLMLVDSTAIRPGNDNTIKGGSASNRFSELFAGNGAINTSDVREKSAFRAMSDAEYAAALEIEGELGFFFWLQSVEDKGDLAREHFGVGAQIAWQIMARHGLVDALDDGMPGLTPYGFLCFDQWDDEYQPVVVIEYEEHVFEQRERDGRDEEGRPRWVIKEVVERVPLPRETGEMKLVRAAGNRFGIRPDQLALFLLAAQSRRQRAMDERIATLESKSDPSPAGAS